MNSLFKLKDVERGRLFAFLTLDGANAFCDGYDHPENLVGVDARWDF